MKKKVLILFAHPALEKSRINRLLIQGIDQIDGLTFHDLYQHYPDFDINVKREQQLLIEHELIVFHHPFYWYSTPSILKEWQDLVLEHGWAYGSKGNALAGKYLMNIITTGAAENAYCETGRNNFTIRQLLSPLEQTANLCKMRFLPPFVVHGSHKIEKDEVLKQRQDLFRFIRAFQQSKIDISSALTLPRINLNLDQLIVQNKSLQDG